MKIQSFASGSRGNCTYIEGKHARILIDVGISYHKILACLQKNCVSLDDLDGILITHTHADHVAGLRVLAKHISTKIYIQEGMYEALKDILSQNQIAFFEKEIEINGLHITAFPTSHDVRPSCGFLIEEEKKSLVYVTDTGYLKERYLKELENKNLYFIEANHDEQMLMNGKYHYQLKQRILGDQGHLSNHLAARYLKKMVGDNTKCVILAHLSEDNNTETLALEVVSKELQTTSFSPSVCIAKQNEETELIEV